MTKKDFREFDSRTRRRDGRVEQWGWNPWEHNRPPLAMFNPVVHRPVRVDLELFRLRYPGKKSTLHFVKGPRLPLP